MSEISIVKKKKDFYWIEPENSQRETNECTKQIRGMSLCISVSHVLILASSHLNPQYMSVYE